jgi:tetrahydromethanopterin S-methyltransferase subunit G
MPGWAIGILCSLVTGIIVAVAGYFFHRYNKSADELPEKYVSKIDCREIRSECRKTHDSSRKDLLDRLDRIETKLDNFMAKLIDDGR